MNVDEKVNVTVQLDPELLAQVDAKAKSLDLNRSQYFRRLIRNELGNGQPELPGSPVKKEQVAA